MSSNQNPYTPPQAHVADPAPAPRVTASQAFGVVVRTFGLAGWVAAFFYIMSAIIAFLAPDYRSGIRPWWQYAVSAVILFLVGWFFLRGAERLVAFAYRIKESDASDI
jgi:hypothetical protein